MSSSAYFVTLTYNDLCLRYSDNGLMTLDYRDFQLFMKRVRFHHDKSVKIKYFWLVNMELRLTDLIII